MPHRGDHLVCHFVPSVLLYSFQFCLGVCYLKVTFTFTDFLHFVESFARWLKPPGSPRKLFRFSFKLLLRRHRPSTAFHLEKTRSILSRGRQAATHRSTTWSASLQKVLTVGVAAFSLCTGCLFLYPLLSCVVGFFRVTTPFSGIVRTKHATRVTTSPEQRNPSRRFSLTDDFIGPFAGSSGSWVSRYSSGCPPWGSLKKSEEVSCLVQPDNQQ